MSSLLAPEAAALVRKIRIVIANHAHLDMLTSEAFQVMLGEKLQQGGEETIFAVPVERTLPGASDSVGRVGSINMTRVHTAAAMGCAGPNSPPSSPAGAAGGGGHASGAGAGLPGVGGLASLEGFALDSQGPTEAAMDFDTALGLVYCILERTKLPYDSFRVQVWVARACSTFALSRTEANVMTDGRVRFAVDWVLRCLAEEAIRGSDEFFDRKFLLNFRHDTSLLSSGLLLAGAVSHGLFGNIWLQAKEKLSKARVRSSDMSRYESCPAGFSQTSSDSPLRRGGAATVSGKPTEKSVVLPGLGSRHSQRSILDSARPPSRMRAVPSDGAPDVGGISALSHEPPRNHHVVISISKAHSKLPPELLSKRIHTLILMDPLPYVLPLQDAYEDLEHIHLVYGGLCPNAVCLIDKVFDDMHVTEEEADDRGFCERTVQQIVWKLMTSLKQAHSRGLVHGSLRMGCCYLNDPDNLDTLQVLEFGLAELFDCPAAAPPSVLLAPGLSDRTDPVPDYYRDFECLAEMTYLMLGGQPICPLTCSMDEVELRFRRGTVSFADKVYMKTSEDAKLFVLDLLRPRQMRPQKGQILPCQEMAWLMSHRWFRPRGDNVEQLNEVYDIIVMRRYDSWRNTLRLRTNFMKVLADHMSLERIAKMWDELADFADSAGRVSWSKMVPLILQSCPILHLLQKVNKAFSENEELPVIHIRDTRRILEAWRRKRVRELLWQVFNRSKAFSGVLPSESAIEGLSSGVLHVWSRPLRVVDIILPPECSDEELQALIGDQKSARFLDLVAKTDAGRRA